MNEGEDRKAEEICWQGGPLEEATPQFREAYNLSANDLTSEEMSPNGGADGMCQKVTRYACKQLTKFRDNVK